MKGGLSRGGRLAPSQITPGQLRFTHFSPYPIAGFNVAFLLLALFCTPWFYWARLGVLHLGLLSHAAELLRAANRSAVHRASSVMCMDQPRLRCLLFFRFLACSKVLTHPHPSQHGGLKLHHDSERTWYTCVCI